jgi:hypothetical protein
VRLHGNVGLYEPQINLKGIVMVVLDWIIGRFTEASTYAAMSAAGVGVGVLTGIDVVTIAAVAVAVLGLVLREKELIL